MKRFNNSKEVKEILKANGIDTKKISIRMQGYTDDCFLIKIKDENINIDDVKDIIKKYEIVDRDERTGEILAGGNQYIFVEYDYKLREDVNNKYNDIINNKIEKAKKDNINIFNNGCCVELYRDDNINFVIDNRDGESYYINAV